MRATIEQITEIVSGVRRRWPTRRPSESVKDLRVDVAHRIADERNIAYQSVIDKPGRKFTPDITNVPQFDALLEQFLVSGSGKLRALLLKHARSADEKSAINAAFGNGLPPSVAPFHRPSGPNEPTHSLPIEQSARGAHEDGAMSIRVHNKRSNRSVEFRRSFGRDLEDAVAKYEKDTVFSLFRAMSVIRCQAAVRSALGDRSISDTAAVEVGMNYDPADNRRGRTRPDPVAVLAAKVRDGEISMDEVRRLLGIELSKLGVEES